MLSHEGVWAKARWWHLQDLTSRDQGEGPSMLAGWPRGGLAPGLSRRSAVYPRVGPQPQDLRGPGSRLVWPRGWLQPGFPPQREHEEEPGSSHEVLHDAATQSFPDQTCLEPRGASWRRHCCGAQSLGSPVGKDGSTLLHSGFPKHHKHRTLLAGCLLSSPWEMLARHKAGPHSPFLLKIIVRTSAAAGGGSGHR